MNTKFLRFVETTLKQTLTLLVVAAFTLAPFAGVEWAYAAASINIDTINGQAPNPDVCIDSPATVVISGTTGTQGGHYSVNIDWGDGSAIEMIQLGNGQQPIGSNEPFSISPTHNFLANSTSITLFLYHGQPGGQDASADASKVVSVCIIADPDPETGTLTLVKEVINDDGGTATTTDWTLSAVGATTTISGNSGDTEITDADVEVGNYDLSESGGPLGYTASDWDCGDATMAATSTVTVGVDDDITCTITNDDDLIPPTPTATSTLTLAKIVVGGTSTVSEWMLTATGATTTITGATGSSTVTNAEVEVGDYALSETGPAGYTAGDWDCGNASMVGTSTVTVGAEPVSCAITNTFDDQGDDPTFGDVVVIKTVINDDQTGTSTVSDFELMVGSTTVTSGATTTVETGDYVVSETGPAGYVATFGGACDEDGNVTVVEGQTVVCTIINDDIPETGEQCPLVELLVVSDEDTQVNGGNATTTFEHSAWTADDVLTAGTWIWSSFNVADPSATSTEVFTRSFNWAGDTNVSAMLDVATDNTYEVRVNGILVGSSTDGNNFSSSTYDTIDVSSEIVEGSNTLEITVTNWSADTEDPEENPAGLLYELRLEGENCEVPGEDEDEDEDDNGGGAGNVINRGGGSNNNDDDDSDDDDDDGEVAGRVIEFSSDPDDDGEVLGDTVALPNTGSGGTNNAFGSIVMLGTLLLGLAVVRERILNRV